MNNNHFANKKTTNNYRPDIGYVQGMSYIACMVILNIPDSVEQFVCFANIILSPFCHDIFDIDGDYLIGTLQTATARSSRNSRHARTRLTQHACTHTHARARRRTQVPVSLCSLAALP